MYAPGLNGWSDVLQSLALTGGEIAKSVATRLRPGEYQQTADTITAYQVPGAVPSSTGLPSAGNVSMGTLMLFGVALVGVVVLTRR